MNRRLLLYIVMTGFLGAGCAEKKASVTPEGGGAPLGPTTRVFIAHASLQGTTSIAPASSNHVMGIHGIGGSFVRTVSTSSNFRMVSGVGVD